MFNIRNRAIAAATAAAIALTSVAVAPATAAPAAKPQAANAGAATDFSSVRRRSNARGNAAFAGVMLGIIGAVGTYAAAREYRKAQEERYRYNYGYYGGGPYYGYRGGPYRYGY